VKEAQSSEPEGQQRHGRRHDAGNAKRPAMDNRRRYIFRGNAAAFGGHIIRPDDIVIEAHGASSLPVAGGRSTSRVGPPPPNSFFNIDTAETFAEGLFENRDQFRAFTLGEVEQDALVALTRVRADVRGFTLGQKFRLTIKRICAELLSRSPRGSGQPSLRIGEIALDGIDFNGHRLVVELDPSPFQRFDTHAKLLVAADDPAFVKESGDALFMLTPRDGGPPVPPSGRLIEANGVIYATIVKSIQWDGAPYPGSTIIGNSVELEPDYGRVFFGEMLITEYSRRLTMVRAALGSDGGGSASGGDVETNGQWSP
jgi:hypothetical protein